MRKLTKGPFVDREELNRILALLDGDTRAIVAAAIAAIPPATPTPVVIPQGTVNLGMLGPDVLAYIASAVSSSIASSSSTVDQWPDVCLCDVGLCDVGLSA